MCLRLTSNEKKIADKDVECYKVLSSFEGIITSPFIGFHYKLGRLYETAIGEIDFGDIHEGFHSCSTIYGAKTYKTLDTEYIFKCIIPQGATYYEGISMFSFYHIKGYVSDKIIIKEQIKANKLCVYVQNN